MLSIEGFLTRVFFLSFAVIARVECAYDKLRIINYMSTLSVDPMKKKMTRKNVSNIFNGEQSRSNAFVNNIQNLFFFKNQLQGDT